MIKYTVIKELIVFHVEPNNRRNNPLTQNYASNLYIRYCYEYYPTQIHKLIHRMYKIVNIYLPTLYLTLKMHLLFRFKPREKDETQSSTR